MAGMGFRYNSSRGFQLSMTLYDQTIYTVIGIANRMVELSRCSYEKAREDLMIGIAKLFYLIQTTDEQIRLTQNNIARLKELREITQAFYDNDNVLEIDVKRVGVNLSNLRVKLDNAESMKAQQLRGCIKTNVNARAYSFGADLSLKIPVFDPFAKRNKVRKIESEQITLRNTIEDTNNQLQTQYSNAMATWESEINHSLSVTLSG